MDTHPAAHHSRGDTKGNRTMPWCVVKANTPLHVFVREGKKSTINALRFKVNARKRRVRSLEINIGAEISKPEHEKIVKQGFGF